ncbi:MAG: 2-phospho-L-lactate transferase [Acidimicrobiia bacterium]|nr:2-phospho-L-lactate transferase [Acidimicrobiia bacterium]
MDRILEASASYRKVRTVLLAGGVGGARMARGFAQVVAPDHLTVVVNVGDDTRMYGALVCADLDTVTYTLAGIEGPEGWGIDGDSHHVMRHLANMGIDTSFQLGDRDLAHCLARTSHLEAGGTLAEFTQAASSRLGVKAAILPVSNDPIRTKVITDGDVKLDFQDYFVVRGQRDRVAGLEYLGADTAAPAPGVVEAIDAADVVVIAPSNPPLSIWPLVAVADVGAAVRRHDCAIAVSPLIGGAAVKGPLVAVMDGLGMEPTNAGIGQAYRDLGIRNLIVHESDQADAALDGAVLAQTLIGELEAAAALAQFILDVASR